MFWRHQSGYFQKTDGDNWIEQPDGTHSFREIARKGDHVAHADQSREIAVRLYADRTEAGAGNLTNNRLYEGGWSTAPDTK